MRKSGADVMRPLWDGRPGRLEVWYATLTDPATGTGFWVHAETVAPSGDRASEQEPFAHGWAAVFPPREAPIVARFGPEAYTPDQDARGFASSAARVDADGLSGTAGAEPSDVTWDLRTTPGEGGPLYTFPRWSWEHRLLPAAQLVAQPGAEFSGTFTAGERRWELDAARGATARVYGHGSARRWAWLHLDLGSGETLEVVAAVAMRRALRAVPPLPFVRFRLADGEGGFRDWPDHPEAAALRLRAWIGRNEWSVRGHVADRRLDIRVAMDPRQVLAMDYTDPDGTAAVCRNSERADAVVALERWQSGWRTERRWDVVGAAHTEIGGRV